MIITFLRSSSYGTHEICPHKFYLEYSVGIKPPSNKSADKGTIVHKAMEVLAHVKKTQQAGENKYEDEAFGWIDIKSVTPEWATKKAYEYYSKQSPHLEWYNSDLTDCIRWTRKAIEFNNGLFDPRNRNIIQPEQRFDITIDKPWAHYEYEIGGEKIEGQLGLKGTIDLIVEDTPDLIEIIDYKTGQRKDWAKDGNEKKSYQDLRYDPQLCLYHYAACQLFPQAEEIFATILFINDGGPFTLCFDKSDLEFTESIIRKKFEDIRDTKIPELNISWRCNKFCFFGMNRSEQDPSKTICQFFKDKVRKDGLEKTMLNHGIKNSFNRYSAGGGKKYDE